MECPSSCLQHEGFEYTRLVFWVHTAHVCSTSDLSTHGSSVVSSPSSYVVSTTYITYYNVMFLCFKSYSLDVFLPFPSSYLSSVNHQHAHKLLLFSTSGKAVHWRNQNSWMALVQTFQKTALSPFTYPSLSQGPFWTATAIALLGLLDLGLCAGLKRQKNVRNFVHRKPIILCAFKSNNFLHKFPIISSSSAPNVNTFHKSCIWTPQNSYFQIVLAILPFCDELSFNCPSERNMGLHWGNVTNCFALQLWMAWFYQILVTVKAKFARESGKTTCA